MSQKFYITTSIPYVNGKAHIGHALEFTQADVLARWRRQIGDEVAFITGADEHGSKIYKTATEQNKDPQAFVDEVTESFKQVHKVLNISYDGFIRTSSDAHEHAAQTVWQRLLEKGDVYKGEYEGLYCVGCESFVTEEQARQNGGVCPNHQKPYDKLKEENYFFKLSQYTAPVKAAITNGDFKVQPVNRQHEILQVLEQGLEDISISRPKKSLPWGVAVPNDENQVMYVWFEALINYISAIGYPDNPDYEKFWPADVQVIGKDILRFHAAIWPAMLIAIGAELPKTLFVHGFISSGGQKMSKSIGNVVDPFAVVEQYNTDAFRYYLLRHIPPAEDGDFTFEKFERAYNGELANDLGNLVSRLANMIKRYQQGVVGAIPEPEHDIADYNQAMANFEFNKALEATWVQIRGLNQYLEEEKPWEIAKSGDQEHLREIMSYSVGALNEISRLLLPFMPDTAKAISALFANGLVNGEIPNLFPKKYHYTEQPNP